MDQIRAQTILQLRRTYILSSVGKRISAFQIKSFQTLGNTVQDRNGTKLDLRKCGQYGLLQQCLSFALPRFTWPF